RKRAALADTSLKNDSKCSFTECKLRFFVIFCLVSPALATFCDNLFGGESFKAFFVAKAFLSVIQLKFNSLERGCFVLMLVAFKAL
ncbi:MAG: hypothetical protein ACR2PX_27590, partial [Endozoicomonas sp.]|uniref:hypothetical protein n=1 Tax=Endozoicomonas sp. TaxID=1892382 RepID=UPI003D9BBDC6